MKALLLLLATAILATGCSTVNQAKKDWQNFRTTVEYNSKQPVVYKYAYW